VKELKLFAGYVYLATMSQMTAMIEIHGQYFPSLGDEREIYGLIGLRTGMGLQIGMFRSKEFLGPLSSERFDFIHYLATAIVPIAGITFGVFVGQTGAGGFHHRLTGKVLRSDQLQVALLSFIFFPNQPLNLWIGFRQRLEVTSTARFALGNNDYLRKVKKKPTADM
jgi:hypothetical protein